MTMIKYICFAFFCISYLCACSTNEKNVGTYYLQKIGKKLVITNILGAYDVTQGATDVLKITKDSFFYSEFLGDVGISYLEIRGTYFKNTKNSIYLKYTKPQDKIRGEEYLLGKDSIKINVFFDNMEQIIFGTIFLNMEKKAYFLNRLIKYD